MDVFPLPDLNVAVASYSSHYFFGSCVQASRKRFYVHFFLRLYGRSYFFFFDTLLNAFQHYGNMTVCHIYNESSDYIHLMKSSLPSTFAFPYASLSCFLSVDSRVALSGYYTPKAAARDDVSRSRECVIFFPSLTKCTLFEFREIRSRLIQIYHLSFPRCFLSTRSLFCHSCFPSSLFEYMLVSQVVFPIPSIITPSSSTTAEGDCVILYWSSN